MNTYFQQLQKKYDSPSKAHKYYMLSKDLIGHMVVHQNAPTDIFDIKNFQEKINNFCYDLVENPVNLYNYFGFEKKEDLIHFISIDQNFEILNFLEIGYDFREQLLDEKLEKIVQDFGLVSITVGQAKLDKETLEHLYNGFNQLSLGLDIPKQQVGLNQLNFCMDKTSEIGIYSAYVDRFKNKNLKIYMHSSVLNVNLAHEWMHFIDIVTAEHRYYNIYGSNVSQYRLFESQVKNSIFSPVLKQSNINNQNYGNHITQNHIYNNIQTIIEKYSNLNMIKKEKELINYINHIFAIKDFNNPNIINNLKQHQKKDCGLLPFILSELNVLNYNSNNKNSVFMEYAIYFDKIMKKIGILYLEDCYSTKKLEIVARIFESYIDHKLKEKKLCNLISNPTTSFYVPQKF